MSNKLKTIKTILKILFPIFFINIWDFKRCDIDDIKVKPKKPDLNNIELTGKKVKLVTDYPLKINLTRGNIYDVINEIPARKRLKNTTIPVDFAEIINDDGETVIVTLTLFEEV